MRRLSKSEKFLQAIDAAGTHDPPAGGFGNDSAGGRRANQRSRDVVSLGLASSAPPGSRPWTP